MRSREELVTSMRSLGLLQDNRVERALRDVPQERFLPDALSPLALADMPLPVLAKPSSATLPSLRCLIAAVGLLEPSPGLRVLLVGARGGYPGALLASIVGAEHITIADRDPALRSVTRERLHAAGLDALQVVAEPPQGVFDRILIMDHRRVSPSEVAPLLADPGSLISRGRGVHDLTFVKMVRNGGETTQFSFNEATSRLAAGARGTGSMDPVDYGRLFAVEDLLVHAWEDRVTGHYDEHFRDIADETFAGGPLDRSAFDPGAAPSKWAARQAFQAAYILQSAGELDRAADVYERSLLLAPSAEANTFLGWTYSFMGRYDDAIAACHRAIELDPQFGNPYNDIGAYLIELGRLDDAIPWLEKAVQSPRYCCYFYAHTNLARVYLHKRMPEKARKALQAALRVNPDYAPARELLRHLEHGTGYFA